MPFPFDLHSAAVSDSHLPCHARAMPCSDHAVLLKVTAQQAVERLSVPCRNICLMNIYGNVLNIEYDGNKCDSSYE